MWEQWKKITKPKYVYTRKCGLWPVYQLLNSENLLHSSTFNVVWELGNVSFVAHSASCLIALTKQYYLGSFWRAVLNHRRVEGVASHLYFKPPHALSSMASIFQYADNSGELPRLLNWKLVLCLTKEGILSKSTQFYFIQWSLCLEKCF